VSGYSPEIELALSTLPIARGYHDVWGNYFTPSEEAISGVLKSLRFNTESSRVLKEQLAEWKERGSSPVFVLHGDERIISLNTDQFNNQSWSIVDEFGVSTEGKVYDSKVIFPTNLNCGYYRFSLDENEITLILCPSHAYLPKEKKVWGLSTQLYSVYSKESEGIGDFRDLLSMSRFTQRVGGSFVGVNPLHLLFPKDQLGYSPYSPSSRRALNPLYIRITDVPEFGFGDLRRCDSLRRNRSTLINYQEVADSKLEILRNCFSCLKTDRLREFLDYKNQCSAHALNSALHSALDAQFRKQNESLWGWSVWDSKFQHLTTELEDSLPEEIFIERDFYLYCQWEAERQLLAAGGELELGLYLDLSVGVNPNGAEVWEDPNLFAFGSSAGAPPDLLNVQGQVWGLAPYIPWELSDRAYQPFIETLQFQMKFAGALRIDHIMALQRLYWVPEGFSGKEGMYVNYPLRDLMGIVALESFRNRCIVVGEDLGTVPTEIREEMNKRDILSYKVLYFMKNYEGNGDFKKPDEYPSNSLVTESTHDLPTLRGFFENRDLEVRKPLGLFSESVTYEAEIKERQKDKERLLKLIGLAPVESDWRNILSKLLETLAASSSLVQSVQIEDLLGILDQMNLPGTLEEHPNWKQKLPVSLESLLADQDLEILLERITLIRRGVIL
jgi:(1->4)-alpha-D-glucan 1-alpha-D-glucosylmutase